MHGNVCTSAVGSAVLSYDLIDSGLNIRYAEVSVHVGHYGDSWRDGSYGRIDQALVLYEIHRTVDFTERLRVTTIARRYRDNHYHANGDGNHRLHHPPPVSHVHLLSYVAER